MHVRGPGKEVRAALLSRALERSIIAAGGLNGRVRDGNGCHTPAGGTNQDAGRSGESPPSGGAPFARRLPASKPPFRRRAGRGMRAPAPPAGGGGPGARGAQASRPIRSGMVNASRRLRIRPVERVVFPWPSGASRPGTARLRGGLALRCVQRLSLRGVATRRCPWQDSRNTRGRPPPVLSY